jgi:type IV pilus assembly protein PilW
MRTRRQSAGFSLVELMLAMGLGLVVTYGIVQLFIGNSQTNTLLTGQSRLQESARYALDFISESARGSGYIGCDPDPDKIYNPLNGTWKQLFEVDITRPVEAFDYVGSGGTDVNDWVPGLDRLPRQSGGGSVNTFVNGTGIELADVEPGTDIVAFRRVETPGFPAAAIVQPTADPVVEAAGEMDIGVGDFAVISNCEQAALFRVTAVAPGAGEATLVRGVGGGTFDNSPVATLSELGVAYGDATSGQGTVVGRVVTDVYFVARGVGTNNRDEPTMALWRRSGTAAPVELVEGVHDLQVRFGVDTTPNDDVRAPNRYVDFGALTADDVVRAMRIEITASTVDIVTESSSPVMRTFSTTVSFRNAG